jgi:hypothetical protein
MDASELRRVKELEAENAKLKRMYADLSLENDALKNLIQKNSEATGAKRSREVSGGRAEPVRQPCLRRGRAVAFGLVQDAAGSIGARRRGH